MRTEHQFNLPQAHSESRISLPPAADILSLDGTLPMEFVAPGDRLISRDAGAVTVLSRRYRQVQTRCVRLQPGAIGAFRPEKECLLPQHTRVLIRNEAATYHEDADLCLHQLGHLVNGTTIQEAGLHHIPLIELEFEQPHILYAARLEVAACGFKPARRAAPLAIVPADPQR